MGTPHKEAKRTTPQMSLFQSTRRKGFFITFEGGEGSGKSTQIKEVAKYFKKKKRQVVILREPGSTEVGEAIRAVLLNPALKNMVWQAELLLFLAARAQLIREKIIPALKKNKVVLLDRFEDSTLAYQGYGRGLDMKTIASFFGFVRETCVPDLTFFLDVPVELGLQRAAKRGQADRMEKSKRLFHQKVRRGFQALAKKNPKRIYTIASGRSVEAVRADIYALLDRL